MSSNDASASLVPLDEYLFMEFYKFIKFISSKDFAYDNYTVRRYNESLTIVNYKPMVISGSENSPGYLPFILEISDPVRKKLIENPNDIEVQYGEKGKEKTIHLNLGNVSNVIHAYGFSLSKRPVYVKVMRGAAIKDYIFDVILLTYIDYTGGFTKDKLESTEAKVKTLIQIIESTDPSIRENFYLTDIIYTSDKCIYPRIFLLPKGIVNDISDFLISQYEQNYGTIIKIPPGFTPKEDVQSPELREFIEKLPFDVIAEAVVGIYGSYPALLLPEGDYSQYLTGNERVINLGKSVVIVFGNPQGNPQPQAQEQQNAVEYSSTNEENNLEKILNIELSPYIPDWLKPYLKKYGVKQGESLSRQEREEFAEKVWNELQKNWNRILELLDANNASVLPTTVLALVTKFPSEYKASNRKVIHQSGNVIEETTRSVLSNIFAVLRQNYLIPLLDSFAPDQVLDLRILRPMTPDEFEWYQKQLGNVVQLYKDAYLIFSFVNSFKDKSYEEAEGTRNLKEASPDKLKYLQDLADAYARLKSAGLFLPLIVDANNTLLVGSLKDLSPYGTYPVIRINDLDLSKASEERLKELKSLLVFTKKAFDDQYGALIVKATISPSALDMQVFKTIVKLLGICPEGDEVCLYKARQELSAFPETLKDKFINNLAKETGRNPLYRIQLINLFATLFALVNYYGYLSELKKEEVMNYGISKLRQEEEERARKILQMINQDLKFS